MQVPLLFGLRPNFGQIRFNIPFDMQYSRCFVVLSTVFILLAVSLALGVTVTILSVSNAQTSFALSEGMNARGLLDGCVEDALLFSRASASYTGGTITHPEGSCVVTISKSGSQWTGVVRTNGAYDQAVQVVFERTSSGVTLTRWHALP